MDEQRLIDTLKQRDKTAMQERLHVYGSTIKSAVYPPTWLMQAFVSPCGFLPLSAFCSEMGKIRVEDERKQRFRKRMSILFLILFCVVFVVMFCFIYSFRREIRYM